MEENQTESQTTPKVTTVESMPASKDALTIAGAVLLGCLIISGTLAYISTKVVKSVATTANTTADQAAAQPGDAAKVTLDQVKALFTEKNITFGKKDSKVLFVEFSDPSCPYCHVASGKNPNLNKQAGAQFTMAKDGGTYLPPVPEMKKLVDAGKAAFVWLYANGHGNGELGTQALYCAKEKGKFWEVHDLLMSEAGFKLMNEQVKNDVAKAGDMADFLKSAVKADDMKACLESGKYKDRLTSDMAIAQQFGFKGTPSFFVNTTNFGGAYSYKDMAPVVEKALQ
jgi:protein-disulfide isomerase